MTPSPTPTTTTAAPSSVEHGKERTTHLHYLRSNQQPSGLDIIESYPIDFDSVHRAANGLNPSIKRNAFSFIKNLSALLPNRPSRNGIEDVPTPTKFCRNNELLLVAKQLYNENVSSNSGVEQMPAAAATMKFGLLRGDTTNCDKMAELRTNGATTVVVAIEEDEDDDDDDDDEEITNTTATVSSDKTSSGADSSFVLPRVILKTR